MAKIWPRLSCVWPKSDLDHLIYMARFRPRLSCIWPESGLDCLIYNQNLAFAVLRVPYSLDRGQDQDNDAVAWCIQNLHLTVLLMQPWLSYIRPSSGLDCLMYGQNLALTVGYIARIWPYLSYISPESSLDCLVCAGGAGTAVVFVGARGKSGWPGAEWSSSSSLLSSLELSDAQVYEP